MSAFRGASLAQLLALIAAMGGGTARVPRGLRACGVNKYPKPHQGKRECARRRKQMGTGEFARVRVAP